VADPPDPIADRAGKLVRASDGVVGSSCSATSAAARPGPKSGSCCCPWTCRQSGNGR